MLSKPIFAAGLLAAAASAVTMDNPFADDQFDKYNRRPPFIRYRVFDPGYDIFGICQLVTTDDGSASGDLSIQQLKGQAPSISGTIEGAQPSTEYFLRINEYGNLTDNCANTGREFNNLVEVIDQVVTPGQDESRGRIPNLSAEDSVGELNFDNVEFLQNLAGNNALFGKSITVYLASEFEPGFDSTPTPQACCVIAQDGQPDKPHVLDQQSYQIYEDKDYNIVLQQIPDYQDFGDYKYVVGSKSYGQNPYLKYKAPTKRQWRKMRQDHEKNYKKW